MNVIGKATAGRAEDAHELHEAQALIAGAGDARAVAVVEM